MVLRTKRVRIAVSLVGLIATSPLAAQQAAPPAAIVPAPPPPPSELDPQAPLAPLPGLGVAWPDLKVRDPLEAPAAATDDATAETPRYRVTLAGVEGLPHVREQFDALSVLRKDENRPANSAQIDRRARDDIDLLGTIMQSEGYYDAVVDSDVKPAKAGERVQVTLTVTPGRQYDFSAVRLNGLEAAGAQATTLREAYGVKQNSPVVAEDVIEGRARLVEKLGRTGYPFARVGSPDVVLDHETRDVQLDLNVDPGGRRTFGRVKYVGGKPPFSERHAEVIARWRPGQVYDSALVDDFKRAVAATGLVSQVRATPQESSDPATVDIATTIDPAPFRTLAAEAGYDTGQGIRVEASYTNRNLIKPEGAVTFRGIAGTREQLFGTSLRMGNFRRRDQVLNARLLASHDDTDAYDAYTFEVGGSLERQTTIIWQKPWSYSAGAELLATSQRSAPTGQGALVRRTFFIAALPGTLSYDGSDSLLDPTTGYRLSGRASPEVSLQGNVFGYLRAQIDGSFYAPFGARIAATPVQVAGRRVVLAGRVRLGGIGGAARSTIAPSRLFYAGGGGSVRGFGYQSIGPRNALNQPLGGRSLAEFSLEARVRLPVFGGNFGVVPFLDAGNVYSSELPKFSGLRAGVGLGLRYYSTFGPIRIDVGTPLSRQPGDARLAVQVSLGQAF